MLSLQSPKILSMYASERGARLRREPVGMRQDGLRIEIRRRFGEELMRLGALIAAEPMRPTRAGAR